MEFYEMPGSSDEEYIAQIIGKKRKYDAALRTPKYCKINKPCNLTNPTVDELKKHASFQKSAVFDPTKKLTAAQLKLICPGISKPLDEDFESTQKKPFGKQATIRRDRKYRLEKRVLNNQLVFRAAYLENENNLLKNKLQSLKHGKEMDLV